MMKKILAALLVLALLGACTTKPQDPPAEIADMSGYGINSENYYVLAMEDAYEFMGKETAYLYFGFDTCPWCLELVPLLDTIANEKNIHIYYVNVRPFGEDIRVAENADFQKVYELTKEFLDLNPEGNPHFYVPQLFAVQDGKIVGDHIGALPDHDSREAKMTAEEIQQLKDELLIFIDTIK